MSVLVRVLDLLVSLIEFTFILVGLVVQSIFFVLGCLLMLIQDRLFN